MADQTDNHSLEALTITPEQRRFDALIGVGGIGSGVFFALDGNHTLGREESRSGHYLDRRDYCKLHIIAHYIQVLLGAGFQTYPIGKVGDDTDGKQLVQEIVGAGMNTRYLEMVAGGATLRSFCFVYPDGSGGNLTISNSALATLDAAFVQQATETFHAYQSRGIALAAPEVALEARLRVIEMGRANSFFCAAALTSAEIQTDTARQLLQGTHLVALNLDEAAVLADMSVNEFEPTAIVQTASERLRTINPALWIAITAGRSGSWIWDGCAQHHAPAITTEVASTAGAGDAFMAGLLVGVTVGLRLVQAQLLATLIASLSVTSVHTIHPSLDRRTLSAFAALHHIKLPEPIGKLLAEKA